jgi:hypothetical protein
MKTITSLGALLFAATLLVSPGILAQEEKKGCCEATVEAGKKCKHECCVKAAEGGKVCEKCHPKKEKKE